MKVIHQSVKISIYLSSAKIILLELAVQTKRVPSLCFKAREDYSASAMTSG